MGRTILLFFLGVVLNSTEAASQQRLPILGDTAKMLMSLRVLPHNFYNQHLSFFCKKEVQLQKLTALPVYFRLGSKETVDYLEKKPNAVRTWQ